MDDSDDSGPLSQQRKRRRISGRSARGSDHEGLPVESEDDKAGDFGHEISSKEELHARIAELKGKVEKEKKQYQNWGSAAELKIDKLRSDLIAQSHECRELEELMKMKQDEIHHTKSELMSWEHEYESSKAVTSGREEKLSGAMQAIRELENLATELPQRLEQTQFESKDTSILSMLSSFYREIYQRYFEWIGTQSLDVAVAESDPSPPHDLDKVQTRKLKCLLRGLNTHSSHHIFAQPVTEDDAPDYFDVIKQPMDLSSIGRKLDSDEYRSLADFVSDVRLMFENCREYNGDSSPYAEAADRLEQRIGHLMEKHGLC